VHTFFVLFSPSYPLFLTLTPLPSHWYQSPFLSPLHRTCSAFLFFNFVEEKKKWEKEDIFACLK
jgi:hypothetical protein